MPYLVITVCVAGNLKTDKRHLYYPNLLLMFITMYYTVLNNKFKHLEPMFRLWLNNEPCLWLNMRFEFISTKHVEINKPIYSHKKYTTLIVSL